MMHHIRSLRAWLYCSMLSIAGLGVLALLPAHANAQVPAVGSAVTLGTAAAAEPTAPAGPVRLRQPSQSAAAAGASVPTVAAEAVPGPSDAVGDFEQYILRNAGRQIRRLGAALATSSLAESTVDSGPAVPADYLVAPGDEILVMIWGSVDADLRLRVDRSGRIGIPRVGAVQVAGVRYGDLTRVIESRVSRVFKNFELSVALGQLHGMRVFVTGYVAKPGAYSVSSLSTLVNALMRAGGPSSAGSFRNVELKRGQDVIGRFDLYDLLLKGDRSADRLLQVGDVVHVGPVGVQVAVIGSVNQPAIVELLPGEGLQDALRMAGGLSAIADRGRVMIERLSERTSLRVVELLLPKDLDVKLNHGDVVRAINSTDATVSTHVQNKRVRVEGEVRRPGDYIVPANSTMADAIRAAGGLTDSAFLYGAQFTRASVRVAQQVNYDRALRDLETDFARWGGTQRVSSSDQAAQSQVQAAATTRLIERLRALTPDGRVVLQIEPGAREVPELLLEDQDRLHIPPMPTSVGVFGSVFNSGSYLFASGRTLEDYLRLAGGVTKGADDQSIFVIRANGQVLSVRQSRSRGFFSSGSSLLATEARPGDTIFVPEEMDKTTFIQAAKDWTQILYQLGIGVAGIKSAVQ